MAAGRVDETASARHLSINLAASGQRLSHGELRYFFRV